MTDVRPFRALRYDPARVDLSRVIVPPYDVVARGGSRRALRRAIRTTRSGSSSRATSPTRRAPTTATCARRSTRGSRSACSCATRSPRSTRCARRFAAPDGARLRARGLLRARAPRGLRAPDRAPARAHARGPEGRPAQAPARGAREPLGRLPALRGPRARARGAAARTRSSADASAPRATTSGVEHRLARLVPTRARSARSRASSPTRPVVIADGHHRYETALAYRDERRAAGEGDGRRRAARVAARLPRERVRARERCSCRSTASCALKGAPTDARVAARAAARAGRAARCAIAAPTSVPDLLARAPRAAARPPRVRRRRRVGHAADLLAAARDGELTVRVIHREVIEGVFGLDEAAVRGGAIAYPKSALQTARDLRAGRGAVALYLNPLTRRGRVPRDRRGRGAAAEVDVLHAEAAERSACSARSTAGVTASTVAPAGPPPQARARARRCRRVLRDLGLDESARALRIQERLGARGRSRSGVALPAGRAAQRRARGARRLERVVPDAAAARARAARRLSRACSATTRRARSGFDSGAPTVSCANERSPRARRAAAIPLRFLRRRGAARAADRARPRLRPAPDAAPRAVRLPRVLGAQGARAPPAEPADRGAGRL